MQPRVFVRLSGPDEDLDVTVAALEKAGLTSVTIVLGDARADPWVEVDQHGASLTAERFVRRVEGVLDAAGVGFRVREYGARPIRLGPSGH